MDAPNAPTSKQGMENSHGTRRNTRSTSNQEKEKENAEKEAKNNSSSSTNKDQDNSSDFAKKRQKERVIRAANGEVLEYTTEDDITYRPLDSAYLMTERPDNPYFICTIQEIKVSKRDNAIVVVKWYYRPTEVPDLVYQMLVKDRINQVVDSKIKELIMKPEVVNRELFVADNETTDTYPISCLRGKCELSHYSSINELKDFELRPDHFFYIFSYNPETRRLASSKGETRVGPSHQWTASTRGIFQKAQLPDLLKPDEQGYEGENRTYEDMTWEPKVNYCDLIMCLRAARSLAAFAGVCDGVSPEEGCIVASRDDTTINALRVLYENNGNPRKAIDALVKNPVPVTIESKWTEEQVKRFQRGLRQHGKDFFKIRKELLPMKETRELVEFYYLWKKTPDGLMIRPHRKHRRQAAMKKSNNKSRSNNANGSADQTSTEEETEESEESEKETHNYTCNHCLTSTSPDWLVGGKEGVMLCTDCRIFYKKYGENRPVIKVEDIDSANETDIETPPAAKNQMPPFLFKPIKEEKITNLINRKPAKSLTKVNSITDIKKPNKRQWSDSEEALVKQEVLPAGLKRPKTEVEEVDNRLQTNQDGGTRISNQNQISTESSKELPVTDLKPLSTYDTCPTDPGIMSGHRLQGFSTCSVTHAVTTVCTSTEQEPLTKSTSIYHLKTISSTSLTPFVPAGHNIHPSLSKSIPTDVKSQLGLNMIPRNGVLSSMAYFGSSAQPIYPSQTTTTTTGLPTSAHTSSATTTVSTAHMVRSSPTVDQGARSPKLPDASSSTLAQHTSNYHLHGPRHGNEQTHHSGHRSPNTHGSKPYYRPTAIKSEVGAYQPPNVPSSDTYRRNPRFPFDPCVTDQIISKANTSRAVIKEERNRPSSPSNPVPDHRLVRPPVRGSPTMHYIKTESHHNNPQQFGPPHRMVDPPPMAGHHEPQRTHPHSPNSHGRVPPSSSSHPGQGQPSTNRPYEKSSPLRPTGGGPPATHTMTQPTNTNDDSDVELISATRPKTPPPVPVEILTHHGNSGRFLKIWNREQNSCFRTDYIFAPSQASEQKRKQAQQQYMKTQQQQGTPQQSQDHHGHPAHKHQRTPSRTHPHSDQEKKREEKPENAERTRREGPGPLSSSMLSAQPRISTPGHGNPPRTTPTRTPTTAYDHRPTPSVLMSPFHIGTDTPALRQLQQYAAYTDMQRNEAAMQPLLYQYYMPGAERELRERELRERDSRERLSKMGMDIKPQDLFDPHNPNMQHLHPSAVVSLSQGLHMAGIPVSLAGQHLASMEHQLQLRQQYQAQLLSAIPPGANPHAALAAAGIHPGAIAQHPFTHPEAAAYQNAVERLSAERLQAERLAAEQYQLELLHHHQHSHVHSHLHLHQPGQPGAPPPPGPPGPLGPLPHPPPGLAVIPEQMFNPYAAAMQAAAMSPFAASAANPLLLNPAIRNQQAALMHSGIPPHLHANPLVGGREQPHPLSATQHLQAVHEQHARAEAFQQQQFMAARLAGHKP